MENTNNNLKQYALDLIQKFSRYKEGENNIVKLELPCVVLANGKFSIYRFNELKENISFLLGICNEVKGADSLKEYRTLLKAATAHTTEDMITTGNALRKSDELFISVPVPVEVYPVEEKKNIWNINIPEDVSLFIRRGSLVTN